MGGWYWIGLCAGLGTGAGVLLAGVAGAARTALIAAGVVALAAGAGIGLAIDSWQPGGIGDVVAGVVGGLAGMLGAATIVGGALRRGGTRGGTATLVAGGALLVAALALAGKAHNTIRNVIVPLRKMMNDAVSALRRIGAHRRKRLGRPPDWLRERNESGES